MIIEVGVGIAIGLVLGVVSPKIYAWTKGEVTSVEGKLHGGSSNTAPVSGAGKPL